MSKKILIILTLRVRMSIFFFGRGACDLLCSHNSVGNARVDLKPDEFERCDCVDAIFLSLIKL